MKDLISNNLGVKYAKTNRGYVTEQGQFFSIDEVVDKSKEEIETLNEYKKQNEPLYDYPYALTTGFVRKKRVDYSFTADAIEEVPVVRTKSIKRAEENIILPFLFIIPLLAVILSGYFTYTHQSKYLTPFWAMLFSVVIVVFNTIALSLITMFFRRKEMTNKAIGCILSLFWLVTMLYSISNMLDVMYDKAVSKNKVLEVEAFEVNASSLVLQAKEDQIELKKNTIASKEKAIEAKQVDIDHYDSLEWTTRAFQLRQEKTALTAELIKLNEELQKLIDEKSEIIIANPEASVITQEKELDTFYTAVAGKNANKLEVYITMLPAVFFDFIAPFLMAIGIYLVEDRRKSLESNQEG